MHTCVYRHTCIYAAEVFDLIMGTASARMAQRLNAEACRKNAEACRKTKVVLVKVVS